MEWQDVPETVDAWTVKLAAPAYDLRQAVADIYMPGDTGYYLNANTERAGLFWPAIPPEFSKLAAAAIDPVFLTYHDLATGPWVKVAYSPTIRRTGELLNFFPGQYPGGIPNAPSPLAAMLTSGLLGAGIGYGGGKLLSNLLPQKFGKKLGRTGAVLGAALGAAPGALWAGTNYLADRPVNDPGLLNHPPDAEPNNYPEFSNGVSPEHLKLGSAFTTALDHYFEKHAVGFRRPDAPGAITDVNIDALGRTLWDTGANPALAATTMATMYAAQQLPDPRSRPGWATGHQLGQLAQNAAGDYVKGLLVGAALNGVVGTPLASSTYGLGNMALGVIGSVVPKLFGE